MPPKPEAGELVVFKALFDRGFSFPPSQFMLDILKRYNAQPHNFSPNSWLYVAAHVALCEGYLGIPPSIELLEYFFQIKKESIKSKGPLALCGSISFKFRGKLNYPVVTGHESTKDWQAYFFYVKSDAALETSGYPAFAPTAAEENEF